MVTSDILLSITKNIFVLSCLTGALPGPGPGAAAGLHAVPGAGLGVEVAVLTSLGPALTRRVTLTRDTGYLHTHTHHHHLAELLALDLGHGACARVPVHHLLLASVRQPGQISK